jgi:hypothetical protein
VGRLATLRTLFSSHDSTLARSDGYPALLKEQSLRLIVVALVTAVSTSAAVAKAGRGGDVYRSRRQRRDHSGARTRSMRECNRGDFLDS